MGPEFVNPPNPENNDKPEHAEKGAPVIFSCSGAADVGGLADAAARSLSCSGVMKMYCLAGIGARVEQIIADVSEAERLIVAVDGCEGDCSRRVLEQAGFRPALHIRITDLGMPKNRTGITGENLRKVTDEIRRRLPQGESPPEGAA